MTDLESSDKDEIRRLRELIKRLEAVKGTTVMSVEVQPRTDKNGLLVYVTAPGNTDEQYFAMLIYHEVKRAFSAKGVELIDDLIDDKQAAPPAKLQ